MTEQGLGEIMKRQTLLIAANDRKMWRTIIALVLNGIRFPFSIVIEVISYSSISGPFLFFHYDYSPFVFIHKIHIFCLDIFLSFYASLFHLCLIFFISVKFSLSHSYFAYFFLISDVYFVPFTIYYLSFIGSLHLSSTSFLLFTSF